MYQLRSRFAEAHLNRDRAYALVTQLLRGRFCSAAIQVDDSDLGAGFAQRMCKAPADALCRACALVYVDKSC
jgi:hypothetical protein